MTDEELGDLGMPRREFFKKMLAIGFALPVVTTFALDGVASGTSFTQSVPNSTKGGGFDDDHEVWRFREYRPFFNRLQGPE